MAHSKFRFGLLYYTGRTKLRKQWGTAGLYAAQRLIQQQEPIVCKTLIYMPDNNLFIREKLRLCRIKLLMKHIHSDERIKLYESSLSSTTLSRRMDT